MSPRSHDSENECGLLLAEDWLKGVEAGARPREEDTMPQTPISIQPGRLRHLRIHPDESTDDRLEHLKSITTRTLPERPMKHTEDLQSVLQNFLNEAKNNPDVSCYPAIDQLSYQLDLAKTNLNLPVGSNRYYDSDLDRCLFHPDHQQTVILDIINRHFLPNLFHWSCGAKWKTIRLPSSRVETVALPKPDLALSFTSDSFTGQSTDDPIPAKLEETISPENDDRCFPFFFMNLMKGNVEEAYNSNLLTASQALYNIHSWMTLVKREQEFFEKVRVFSLMLNGQNLDVRVHRADAQMCFHFVELLPFKRYTKDETYCQINTILTEYAEKELHPILRRTFKEVVCLERENISADRKENQNKRRRLNPWSRFKRILVRQPVCLDLGGKSVEEKLWGEKDTKVIVMMRGLCMNKREYCIDVMTTMNQRLASMFYKQFPTVLFIKSLKERPLGFDSIHHQDQLFYIVSSPLLTQRQLLLLSRPCHPAASRFPNVKFFLQCLHIHHHWTSPISSIRKNGLVFLTYTIDDLLVFLINKLIASFKLPHREIISSFFGIEGVRF